MIRLSMFISGMECLVGILCGLGLWSLVGAAVTLVGEG